MDRWIDHVQGHEGIWRHLLELLRQDGLPHALAFTGPAGIGKKRMAFSLAQAGICTAENPPCGDCPACARVNALRSESLLVLSPMSGMLKLEQAHEILHFLQLRSLSRRRFVVIDDAANMNAAFANASLKILEEPPAGTHFIFVLPALSQLLPTLRSRLQTVRFFPLPDRVLSDVSHASGWTIQAAQGSFAALEEWSTEEARALKTKAVVALADLVASRRSGYESLVPAIKEKEPAELVSRLFQQFFRDVLYLRENLSGVVHADAKSALHAWSEKSRQQILTMWRESFQLQQDIAANLDRTLSFESFFCRGRRLLESPNAVMD